MGNLQAVKKVVSVATYRHKGSKAQTEMCVVWDKQMRLADDVTIRPTLNSESQGTPISWTYVKPSMQKLSLIHI